MLFFCSCGLRYCVAVDGVGVTYVVGVFRTRVVGYVVRMCVVVVFTTGGVYVVVRCTGCVVVIAAGVSMCVVCVYDVVVCHVCVVVSVGVGVIA